MFWFPSTYKSYVYTILQSVKCAIALCLKNVHTLVKKYFIPKKSQNNYNSNLKDHRSQINLINEIIIKKFKILQELPKCDREIQSEQMLLEKWRQQIYLKQGCHRPSICKKCNYLRSTMKRKARYACTRSDPSENSGRRYASNHYWKRDYEGDLGLMQFNKDFVADTVNKN